MEPRNRMDGVNLIC